MSEPQKSRNRAEAVLRFAPDKDHSSVRDSQPSAAGRERHDVGSAGRTLQSQVLEVHGWSAGDRTVVPMIPISSGKDEQKSKMDKALKYFQSRGGHESFKARKANSENLDGIAEREHQGRNESKNHSVGKPADLTRNPNLINSLQATKGIEVVEVEIVEPEPKSDEIPISKFLAPQKGRSIEISMKKEHGGVINRCLFSPDGSLLLTVAGDCTCRIFRRDDDSRDLNGFEQWSPEATLIGHESAVWSVAMSANNDFVFTVGGDETIRLWVMGTKLPPEIDTVEIRKMLGKRGEKTTGTRAEIFARLKMVMSADEDEAKFEGFHDMYLQTERQWLCISIIEDDPPPANAESRLSIPSRVKNPIFDCALHPSNMVLATAWGDGSTRIYVGNRQGITQSKGFTHPNWIWDCVQKLRDHSASVFRCSFSASGDILATVSKDQLVILYNFSRQSVARFEKAKTLSGHMGPVLGISHHPSGRMMATGSCDTNAVIWFLADVAGDEKKWTSVGTLFGHKKYVKACSFRDDGLLLATASRDRTVRLWGMVRNPIDVSQLRKFTCLEVLRCHDEVCSVQFGSGPCMSLLIAGTLGGMLCRWDTQTCVSCGKAPATDKSARIDFKLNPSSRENRQNDIIFKDEGQNIPPRPLTAMSDWSRMQTPNHVAPPLAPPEKKPQPGLQFKPTVYAGVDERGESVQRFSTMEPHCEFEPRSVTKRIKDYTAQSETAKAKMAHFGDRISIQDVKKVMKISRFLLRKENLGEFVKLQHDAALAVLESSPFGDMLSIADVLTKFINILSELLQKGMLYKKLPHLRRHLDGTRWLFGKQEFETLMGTPHPNQKHKRATSSKKKRYSAKAAHAVSMQAVAAQGPDLAEGGDEKGNQLAAELSKRTLAETKRIVGERIVKLITPELVWTRDAVRTAGWVAVRLLEALDNEATRRTQLQQLCSLLFNLKKLYPKALEVLQQMEIAPPPARAPPHGGGAGAMAPLQRMEADSLALWPKAGDCPPASLANRCSCPLFASSTPTTIGTVFAPGGGGGCRVLRFEVWLALATTATTREARELDRSSALGVSFKFLVAEWDANAQSAGAALLLSDERVVTERVFKRFVLDFEADGRTVALPPGGAALIGLTSHGCRLYTKGAAWVSAVGRPSEREARRGAKYPTPPDALSGGMRVFAGAPDGDPRNRWVAHDEIMACQVSYAMTS